MILDNIKKLHHYFPGLPEIATFMATLGKDTPDGLHEIIGRNVYASVSRYSTRPRQQCRPESHRQYVDIQMLLDGAETIEWFPYETLSVETPYDMEKDIEFHARPSLPGSRIALVPGVFAVFFPEDAHMPQCAMDGAPEDVVKVVFKIAGESLNP